MSGEEPRPDAPEGGRPDTEELANPQPDLARPGDDTPRRTDAKPVYSPGEGKPADDVEAAEDAGQQVVGELREREHGE